VQNIVIIRNEGIMWGNVVIGKGAFYK